MKKNRIRLNESDLHKIVKESVKRVMKEGYSTPSLEDRLQYSKYSSALGDTYEGYDENVSNISEIYQRLCKLKDFADWAFEDAANEQNELKRYFDYILKCLNRGIACFGKIIKVNQMKTGIQPEVHDGPHRYKDMVDIYDPYNPRFN